MEVFDPGSIGLAIVFGLILGAGVLAFWGAGLGRQKYLFLAFVAVLIFFPDQTSWGAKAADDVFNVYSRGTGQFFFSLTTLFLWGAFFITWFQYVFKEIRPPYCNIRKYLMAFGLLFLAHVVAAAIVNAPVVDALSGFGVINVFHMSALLLLGVYAVHEEQDLDLVIKVLLAASLARGLFGLVRFAFFGGDPVNVYANIEKVDVSITFYDITDSLIACVATYYAAGKLMADWRSQPLPYRMFLLVVALVGLAVIVLSSRRNAWVGLVLAGLWFAVCQSGKKKLIILGVLGALVPVFGIVSALRFSRQTGGTGNVFADIMAGGGVTGTSGRFLELYQAIETLGADFFSWVFGIGTWAQFAGYGIDFHQGNYGYVHSGFIHILMKTGVVGVGIFVAILAGFARFVYVNRNQVDRRYRPYFESGLAGLLFLIPSLTLATPIIEYRTMLVLGFVLGIPYTVYAVQQRTNQRLSG